MRHISSIPAPARSAAGATLRPSAAAPLALPHASGWRELPCVPAPAVAPSRFRPDGANTAAAPTPVCTAAAPTDRRQAADATTVAPATACISAARSDEATQAGRRRWFGVWLTRPRRVILALAAVWVISFFDFGFTVSERHNPLFVELNPLAAALLSGPTHLLTAFKFGLLGLGTAILVALRRRSLTEPACWFLLAAKIYVAMRWYAYYEFMIHAA